MKPIFILCIGAQKSGTTWLHKQISKSKKVNFGIAKEYHTFDALFNKHCKRFRVDQKNIKTKADNVRYLMQNRVGYYENYFKKITLRKNVKITGDFTPSYALLNKKQYSLIKKKLESVGFEVKVIFLMRDPVERVWSSFRMIQKYQELRKEKKITNNQLIKKFIKEYKNEEIALRSNYHLTIKEIEKVFKQDNILFLFYEQLFNENTFIQIEKFIGIKISFDPNDKINESSVICLPEMYKNKIFSHYKNVYRYCFDRFPETKNFWRKKNKNIKGILEFIPVKIYCYFKDLK